MALQDLTPKLRTRLNQMEVLVGLFVAIAALLLIIGTGYYLKHTAERKGWFVTKARYYTFLKTAEGIHVGDPVRLMGRDVGEITAIDMMPADDQWSLQYQNNVFVQFDVRAPYYGYIWVDSRAKINAADLLGKRVIELTRGLEGMPTYRESTNTPSGFWNGGKHLEIYDVGTYQPVKPGSKGFWLTDANEPPTFNDRAEALISQVEQAIPDILSLTNQLQTLLSNGSGAAANLDALLAQTKPAIQNIREVTELLKNPKGGLGDWLLPTNISDQLATTLGTADTTLLSANQNLSIVSSNLNVALQSLNVSLENMGELTGDLNRQVWLHPEILSEISSVVTNTDALVQGLKHHWFLKSAFKKEE